MSAVIYRLEMARETDGRQDERTVATGYTGAPDGMLRHEYQVCLLFIIRHANAELIR